MRSWRVGPAVWSRLFRTPEQDLLGVLAETRQLLLNPLNDFSWSSWGSADVALQEIDGFIETIRTGGKPDLLSLDVIFMVTGPLQEVSLSSDWADTFLKLAARFDKALARYKKSTGMK